MKHFLDSKKKAQSSFEMLIIFGFSFLLIILIGGYYLKFSATATSEIDVSQRDKIFTDVMDKATRVFYQGSGNRLTLNAHLPDGIINISIINATNGTGFEFDYLNVTYIDNKQIRSSIYFPNELFVRFNCTQNPGSSVDSCYLDPNDNWVYKEEFISQGPKQIRVESKGDYVLVDFVRYEG